MNYTVTLSILLSADAANLKDWVWEDLSI